MQCSTPPRLAKMAKAKPSSHIAAKLSENRKLPPTHKRPSPANVNNGTNSSKKAKPAKNLHSEETRISTSQSVLARYKMNINIFPSLEARRDATTRQFHVPNS
jgi:hypothetical protein